MVDRRPNPKETLAICRAVPEIREQRHETDERQQRGRYPENASCHFQYYRDDQEQQPEFTRAAEYELFGRFPIVIHATTIAQHRSEGSCWLGYLPQQFRSFRAVARETTDLSSS